MLYLGEHNKRKVFWWEFSENNFEELPNENWICFALDDKLPNQEVFERFARISIQKNILEFKVFGRLSEELHDWFDQIVVSLNVFENQANAFVITTWHNNEGLASAFWQSFFATSLPDKTNFHNLKIICFHFDNVDKTEELKNFIKRFKEGWLPSNDD